jgi:hypothetical protein
MWTCKNCNAENEDNFDICWSCGSDKAGTKPVDKVQADLYETNKKEASEFTIDRHTSDFKKNKSFVLAVAAIIIFAFFMPWIKAFGFSASAWDLTVGDIGTQIDSGLKYLVLLILLSCILILYGTAANEGKYFLVKRFLFSLPILTLIFFAFILSSNLPRGNDFFAPSSSDIFKLFSIGFWTTLLCSIILCYLGFATNFGTSLALVEASTTPIETLETKAQEINIPTSMIISNQSVVVLQLERIQKMKQDGLISEEEYQKMKNKIIAAFD